MSDVIASPVLFALAGLVVFLGGLVRGYAGFGSGLVMAPLVAVLWGPVAAVATTVTLGFFAFLQVGWGSFREANWRAIGPVSLAAIAVVPAGTYLLVTLDPVMVKRIIAAAVLVATLVTLKGWTYSGPRGVLPSIAAGAVGGLINGLASVGGPPIVLYLMSLPDSAATQRANINMCIGLMGVAVLAALVAGGSFELAMTLRIALLFLPFAAGVWMGGRLFRLLPADTFRRGVLWMLIAMSLSILVFSA
jgi:uncharacterized membrane protein YfcA